MKTKIPIKKYALLNPPLAEVINRITMYPFHECANECAEAIAHEYKHLLAHHEEETKFLIETIERLEENQK